MPKVPRYARPAATALLAVITALACAAWAQDDVDALAEAFRIPEGTEVAVRFHSDLPSRGGEVLLERRFEPTPGARVAEDDALQDARYAEVELAGRAFAFPVHAPPVADGEVRVSVRGHDTEGTTTTETHAGSAGHVPLTTVARTLASGLLGDRPLVAAARAEDGAYVVVYLAPRADVTAASTIPVDEEHVIALLRGSAATILTVRGEASTFADLEVGTSDGTIALLGSDLWSSAADGSSEADLEPGVGLPLDD